MLSYSLIIFCITLLINPILCYIPETRIGHNSVIIHNQLLVFGGRKNESVDTSTYEMLYLDLTKPFDSKSNPWELLKEGYLPVYTYFSTSIVSTLDDDIIYLIGGYRLNITTNEYENSNVVYMYNYSTIKWTTPEVDNATPRQEITGVTDNKGTVYIFGGNNMTNFTMGTLYNDMQIFNVSTMIWSKLSINHNLPSPSCAYTATILKNGIIVYLGGVENDKGNYISRSEVTFSSMKTIRLFDTLKTEWLQMNVTGGDDIAPRVFHSSVLTTDGHIILFGGVGGKNTAIGPKLAILDTNKDIYEWRIPSSSDSSPYLYAHTANLYGNYMIVTFGYDMDNKDRNSQIYLLDVTHYTWVTTYTPPIITKPFSKALAIGLGVGGGIFLATLISIGVRFFKRHRHTSILKIPGSASII
ncbi:hypothetical protein Glove_586g11 [Diversispora epigaea]|uniref:Galactose oxidase n=1 Tax=Diversispora epigaea TaxID=1348612 RepID=A0A397GBJ7_9GLOM|nr:hypothetical protein Glove_586g11 [Diversispora epigaea]